MGDVFLVEQLHPFQKTVALKVLKAGLSDEEAARFEFERIVLARMEHSLIARVFDAGVAEDGRPYIAMEFIDGVPITEYCNANRLTVRDRLQLVAQVCEAVQHAHHNSVIHRDLKPTNILVTVENQRAIPKLIDFGMARESRMKFSDEDKRTRAGMALGTPEYMSPEQTTGSLVVDARTDVYSLGVILYELLTETLPLDPHTSADTTIEEYFQSVRTVDPERPSARIRSLGRSLAAVASTRRVGDNEFARSLRRDLDWIVMRCLEKSPRRRYDSPWELGKDISRYLKGEPIEARPPSVLYRAGKFTRRHSALVGLTAALLLFLASISILASLQAARLSRERDRATRVAEFMVSMFNAANPDVALGHSVSARDLLDRGAARVEKELTSAPEVQAELLRTMGAAYSNLAVYDSAERLFNAALEIEKRVFGPDDRLTLQTYVQLSMVYQSTGRLAEAETISRHALETAQRVFGNEDDDTLNAKFALAIVVEARGRHKDAEQLFTELLPVHVRKHGENNARTFAILLDLANSVGAQGRRDESMALARRAMEGERRTLGDDHPDTLTTMNNVAIGLSHEGKCAEAEAMDQDILGRRERVLGAGHPDTLNSLLNLAANEGRCGMHEPALVHLKTAVERGISITSEELADNDFAILHGDPRFDAIVAAVKKRTGG